jgi:hypothetical protein
MGAGVFNSGLIRLKLLFPEKVADAPGNVWGLVPSRGEF